MFVYYNNRINDKCQLFIHKFDMIYLRYKKIKRSYNIGRKKIFEAIKPIPLSASLTSPFTQGGSFPDEASPLHKDGFSPSLSLP